MWLQALAILILMLIAVAFFSLYERKFMALSQSRVGPSKILIGGNLQPIADAMKLISKFQSSPSQSNSFLYYFSPFLAFIIPLMVWGLIPIKWGILLWPTGVVMLLIYFSLSVYSLMLCGWYSNSKYSFLGSVRAVSQSISYEVGLTLILCYMCIMGSTLSLDKILSMQEVMWLGFSHLCTMVALLITFVAETNRSPFDLTEGESELVSGYSVEYGGLSYTLVFLGENLSILWVSSILSVYYGNMSTLFWFSTVSLFILIRSTLPRLRYDYLMEIFWYKFLPLTLGICQTMLILSMFNQSQSSGILLLPESVVVHLIKTKDKISSLQVPWLKILDVCTTHMDSPNKGQKMGW